MYKQIVQWINNVIEPFEENRMLAFPRLYHLKSRKTSILPGVHGFLSGKVGLYHDLRFLFSP